ncbi:Uncharacterised protein [Vibrio cholerae]|nr:Uncharacterised protein [Vibrio cholerae]
MIQIAERLVRFTVPTHLQVFHRIVCPQNDVV